MSARCCEPAHPSVIKVPDRPILPPSSEIPDVAKTSGRQSSARILDEPFCTVPTIASKEVKTLINNLRARQDELFREVLDQQKELQKEFQRQLLAMHSAVKENTEAHADWHAEWKKHQEDFIAEFRDFSCKSRVIDLADLEMRIDGKRKGSKELLKSEIAELSENDDDQFSSAGDESGAAVANGDPERHVTSTHSATPSASRLSREQLHSTAEFMRHVKNYQPATSEGHEDQTKFGRCASRVSRRLKSKEFEIAIAVAIVINAFIMCWETQYQGLDVGFNLQFPARPTEAHVVWAGAETAFTFFDWFFGILFFIEMIVKLVCWRSHYFYVVPVWDWGRLLSSRGDSCWESSYFRLLCGIQGWNLLDFFCVAAFILSKIAAAGALNPQTLRLSRLFRLGRLVRLCRFLESLDHLYVMTTAISGLTQVLAWTIVLLTLILLTCNLFLTQILHDTYFDQVKASDLTEDQLRRHHQMYEYFGTCTRCMLSMWEITLGDFQDIARLLTEEVSHWFIFICLVHKLTIGFAVIGVITGVILQETFKVADTDDIIMFRKKKMQGQIIRKKMSALFEALDESHDGKLARDEFLVIGQVPEIKIWLGSLGIETDDLQTLFSLIDVDDNGYITLDELAARMPRIQGNARSIDVLKLQRSVGEYALADADL